MLISPLCLASVASPVIPSSLRNTSAAAGTDPAAPAARAPASNGRPIREASPGLPFVRAINVSFSDSVADPADSWRAPLQIRRPQPPLPRQGGIATWAAITLDGAYSLRAQPL